MKDTKEKMQSVFGFLALLLFLFLIFWGHGKVGVQGLSVQILGLGGLLVLLYLYNRKHR